MQPIFGSQINNIGCTKFAENKVMEKKNHNTKLAEQSQALSGWTLL